MLKGLLTRQIFLFVDLLLAVLTVFVAYQVFTKLFQAPVSAVAPTTDAMEAAAPTLPTVGPRDSYQMIVASRLFGPAGEVAKPPEPDPEGPKDPEIITEFEDVLKLKGTSFTKIRPNALIERQGVGAKVYETGDEVIEGKARLDEVHNRWVYLFNVKKKQREILRMDEDIEVASAEPEKPMASTQGNPSGGTTFKRDEVAEELASMTENMAELISTTTPEAVTGPDGKVIGYTAKNLGEIPLAKKIGFKDGDVVKAINGLPVDSIESITNAIGQLENDSDFRITIMRGGKPQLLKFKLE